MYISLVYNGMLRTLILTYIRWQNRTKIYCLTKVPIEFLGKSILLIRLISLILQCGICNLRKE